MEWAVSARQSEKASRLLQLKVWLSSRESMSPDYDYQVSLWTASMSGVASDGYEMVVFALWPLASKRGKYTLWYLPLLGDCDVSFPGDDASRNSRRWYRYRCNTYTEL